MSAKTTATAGAGWAGLLVAVFSVAENYLDRDRARIESRTVAAKAAARAKIDADDESQKRYWSLTATVVRLSERTRLLERLVIDGDEFEEEEGEDEVPFEPAPAPTAAYPPRAAPKPVARRPLFLPPKPKAERIQEQQQIYLEEVFSEPGGEE